MKRDLPRRQVIINALELMGWRPVFDFGMNPRVDGVRMTYDYINESLGKSIAYYTDYWEWDTIAGRVNSDAYPPVAWSAIKTSVLRSVLQEVSDDNRS